MTLVNATAMQISSAVPKACDKYGSKGSAPPVTSRAGCTASRVASALTQTSDLPGR